MTHVFCTAVSIIRDGAHDDVDRVFELLTSAISAKNSKVSLEIAAGYLEIISSPGTRYSYNDEHAVQLCDLFFRVWHGSSAAVDPYHVKLSLLICHNRNLKDRYRSLLRWCRYIRINEKNYSHYRDIVRLVTTHANDQPTRSCV